MWIAPKACVCVFVSVRVLAVMREKKKYFLQIDKSPLQLVFCCFERQWESYKRTAQNDIYNSPLAFNGPLFFCFLFRPRDDCLWNLRNSLQESVLAGPLVELVIAKGGWTLIPSIIYSAAYTHHLLYYYTIYSLVALCPNSSRVIASSSMQINFLGT